VAKYGILKNAIKFEKEKDKIEIDENFYLEDLILSQGKGGRRFERCIDGFEEERKHWRERR
jgi:hypothetical protein